MTDSTPIKTPPDESEYPVIESEGPSLSDVSSMVRAHLGPFEIHEVIGKGGMGVVFCGQHTATRVPVAIKVITRRGASHPHFRRSMHNEVRAVAALDHPGVIRVFDYGEIPAAAEELTGGALRAESPYFAMELVPHGSLVDLVGRVDWAQGKAILLSLLDALAHSHARDVIHRDIKPGNILIDEWGGRVIPRLADFGLAFAHNSPTDASRSIGTPQYMAPEQIETPWREHGPWSDLYSLGCVAYELFCGRKMFQGKSVIAIFKQHLDGTRRPWRTVVRTPEGFDEWLARMLARDATDRFQCAADAARALLALDDSDLPDVRPPAQTEHNFAMVMPVLGQGAPVDHDELSFPKRRTPSMRLVGAGLGLFGLREHSLVGRRAELDLLFETFRKVKSEGAKAVAIFGSEGIGKSKLAGSFAERLAELGLAVPLKVALSDDGGNHGLAQLFASLFRVLGASRVEVAGIIRDRLAQLGCHDTFLWKAAAELVSPVVSDSEQTGGFEFASQGLRTETALQLLKLHAEGRPLVVVVDDAHRDAEFVRFVQEVLARGAGLQILFVMTVSEEALATRPEVREALERAPQSARIRRVDLHPLDEVSHLELVQNLLHLTGDVAVELASRTAGNPRFATSLVGDWVERGVLTVDETGFVPRADVLGRIPDSMVEVWDSRLNFVLQEVPSSRFALEIAAALGSEVVFDEWAAICRSQRVRVESEFVAQLFAHRLAEEERDRWRFTHPGIAESLRRGAEEVGRWAHWKAVCASYLESTGRRRVEVLERIGRYWLEANEFENAVEPLVSAADLRERQGDYVAAERALSAAVQAVEKARHGAGRSRRLAELWVTRARTYAGWGRPDESLRWARKAWEAASNEGWTDITVKSVVYIALAKQWMGAKDSLQWLERGFAALDFITGEFRSDGRALVALAYVATSQGRFAEAERALEVDSRFVADERGRAANAYQRARLAIYRGRHEEAREQGHLAETLYRELGHVPALASTLTMIAEAERKTGHLELAQTLYQQAVELQEQLGQSAIVAKTSIGQILLERREWSAAEQVLLEAMHDAAAGNRRRLEEACRTGLIVVAAATGRTSDVGKLLPRVRDFITETHEADPSMAELLEKAAMESSEHANFRDALKIWQLAATQWELLGDEERVHAARREVEKLSG